MDIQTRLINQMRVLSAQMIQKANSGHPGAPMGMAPMAYALWFKTLKTDFKNPQWPNRDRVVLSNGHASALLYSVLHLLGSGLSLDDLKAFRQWGSLTPGHPEQGHTSGVDASTGPLGQGLANALGFAIAESFLAAHFNRPGFPIMDHRSYAIVGDGCMMEGISSEACSLAGTLKLNKLCVLYDDNQISIEGSTELAFTEDVSGRFLSYGWDVFTVQDGNDWEQIEKTLQMAQNSERPQLIICKTIIGYGCPQKAGKASSHGEPLGENNLEETKATLGVTGDAFEIPKDLYDHARECAQMGKNAYSEWEKMFVSYQEAYPELACEFCEWWDGTASTNELLMALQDLCYQSPVATRQVSGDVLNAFAKRYPNLIGGSADLGPSNKTIISGGGDYSAKNPAGRNLHFGVREQAMAAICNGLALHGGLKVYCGTFLVFSDYMKGSMRMSALGNAPVKYVLTHDSIGVGEDGPTHQPVEQLISLRAIPGLQVFRPADAEETKAAWAWSLSASQAAVLALTRQNLPQLGGTAAKALKGAYVLNRESLPLQLILMASGSEVAITVEAQKLLEKRGIGTRVVSVPCIELFLAQDRDYIEEVLPHNLRARVAVEAASSLSWHRLTGLDGIVIGMDGFGASAPANVLFKEFGFTAENIVNKARALIS